jgi:uncharacterized protein (TIGR02246 family)
MKLALLAWVPAVVCMAAAMADESPRDTDDEAQIRKAVESYVAAYNDADAKALAALWSPEAVYTNPDTGEQAEGRQAIEEQFAAIFAAAPGAILQVRTESIRFVSPNVAVEQGIAILRQDDSAPDESGYSAVYVRRDGQWLLDRVTEESIPVAVSNYEHLKVLEWMIGTWIDQDDHVQVETTCQWTKNKNFIVRYFSTSVRGRAESSGMQIVGWDSAAKKIRSWVFDSDGGFGEGVWSKKGNAWYVASTGTLADGRTSSATHIVTPVDDNTFTWQSINRQAGGELLPNVDAVFVVRQESAE